VLPSVKAIRTPKQSGVRLFASFCVDLQRTAQQALLIIVFGTVPPPGIFWAKRKKIPMQRSMRSTTTKRNS